MPRRSKMKTKINLFVKDVKLILYVPSGIEINNEASNLCVDYIYGVKFVCMVVIWKRWNNGLIKILNAH